MTATSFTTQTASGSTEYLIDGELIFRVNHPQSIPGTTPKSKITFVWPAFFERESGTGFARALSDALCDAADLADRLDKEVQNA